ncbi:hypothetical protein CLG96_14010 [Sphingomonas oleivorans]|uniref:Uncharacterized protein n=1 Tax=Sphingomonas oleivorans TaxID=1735121 RepID=A0A2T5FWS8_9SPHN|nr:tetratricopeptide repeat protein [Sphingomonas oleivorans]PTQ10222.1 hypothetical protein CLG96_14010 [Sphingomonas oleivorans]
MSPLKLAGGCVLAALLAVSAEGARIREAEPTTAYVRARVAEAGADLHKAATGYAAVMEASPDDMALAMRAYRQAMMAGDRKLATRAAKALDARNGLPPDGPLLLLANAVQKKDWRTAGVLTDRIEKERVFAFLVPVLRAWIALGAHDGDPVAKLDAAAPDPLGTSYIAEHRALLMLAEGQTEQGVAALRALSVQPPARNTRLRIAAAAGLAKARQKERALALLEGDDPLLAAARARIAAGDRLPSTIVTAGDGISELIVRVAIDVNRERVTPLGLALVRIATFFAPANASAWLASSEMLSGVGQNELALAALDKVTADDPFSDVAQALRLKILVRQGQTETALAESLKRTGRTDATFRDWTTLGDLYGDLGRRSEAAGAYGRALELAEAARAPTDDLWPLWLLRGGALEQGGDWPQARTALEKALALAPDQAVVLNYLGYAQLERRENLEDAQKLIERASQLRPDDPSITDSLGWAYYLRGNLPKAIETLERAAQGEPGEATINEHLGDAYWAVGRKYEARYAWRAALVQAGERDAARIRNKLDEGLSGRTAAR